MIYVNIFIAFTISLHSKKTGYKVARIRLVNGKPKQVEDFATGWLRDEKGKEVVWGRPVDVVVGPDGNLFVSDDFAGLIYRISYYKGKN